MSVKSIVRSMSGVCSDTTSQDLVLDTRDPQEQIRWTQIVGIERTNAPTTLEVGLRRSRQFYILNAETPGAAARCIKMDGEVVAPGDFVPCARFLGATSGNVLELYAAGVVVED